MRALSCIIVTTMFVHSRLCCVVHTEQTLSKIVSGVGKSHQHNEARRCRTCAKRRATANQDAMAATSVCVNVGLRKLVPVCPIYYAYIDRSLVVPKLFQMTRVNILSLNLRALAIESLSKVNIFHSNLRFYYI